MLSDAATGRRSDERTLVLDALKDETEPLAPREIADVTDRPHTAVRYLLGKMAKVGEVQKVGRGKYLHPDTPPSQCFQPHKGDQAMTSACKLVSVVRPLSREGAE